MSYDDPIDEHEAELAALTQPKDKEHTGAVGSRCRYRGVDGENFEGVVHSIELDDDGTPWGERIIRDDGTPRQVFYSGLIWCDTIQHKPEPATKPAAKKAASTTKKAAAS